MKAFINKLLFRINIVAILFLTKLFSRREGKATKLGLMSFEIFDKRVGIFGGYGMTIRNIGEYLNRQGNGYEADALVTVEKEGTSPIEQYGDIGVIFQYQESGQPFKNASREFSYMN